MLDKRTFDDNPGIITVGQMDGKTHIGSIKEFSPLSSELELRLEQRDGDGQSRTVVRHIPVEHVAFVAFHKDGFWQPPRDNGELRKFELMVNDGHKFPARLMPDHLESEVGFYALPEQDRSPFCEYFFFAWGVRAKVDVAPLGELLVERHVIGEDELRQGLEQQAFERGVRLGDILKEQGAVSPGDVEKVAEKQKAWKPGGRTMRLGELLVAEGVTSQEDIERALEEQKRRQGKRLGQVLVELDIVSEEGIAQALAQKFQLPFVDLEKTEIRPEAVSEVPVVLVERYRLFPYFSDEKNLFIALSDPLALEAISMLQFSVGKRIHEVIATGGQIESYIEPFLISKEEKKAVQEAEARVDAEDDDAVVRVLNRIIIDAYRQGASDIHLEPYGPDEEMQVRFRIDGACRVYRELPASARSQVASRVKIMAGLDISERRRPQDGKIKFQLGQRQIELRVATLPTGEGDEDVVMRILASGDPLPLDQMGFSPSNFESVSHIIKQPYGLILAVGPTGSGKTTTLHSLLRAINTEERKIWTAEDPIEISQRGLRQVQVNSRIGFTFAAAMRAFLRADPDVIMVGEMRDQETAHIGVEASLTGHLVFSTLHTNNAPETITRLLDMGLDPFSFSDALLGIIAQRLARRLCSKCKLPQAVTADELAQMSRFFGQEDLPTSLADGTARLWSAPGCQACGDSGYKGRLAIHEVLANNEAITGAILRKATVAEIRNLALEAGMRTLVQDGITKCMDGQTDLAQVLAVAGS
jgi:type II secretory ATPase GspE/PulE/Tfp pilus assembly ATPase PilB-like protein